MTRWALLGLALSVWAGALALAGSAAPGRGVASDAHRADARGNYGGLKSQRAPLRGAGDVRDNDNKQPYYYRYYSDTDRSPGLLPPLCKPRDRHQKQQLVDALPRLLGVAATPREIFRILEPRRHVSYIRLTLSYACLVATSASWREPNPKETRYETSNDGGRSCLCGCSRR